MRLFNSIVGAGAEDAGEVMTAVFKMLDRDSGMGKKWVGEATRKIEKKKRVQHKFV